MSYLFIKSVLSVNFISTALVLTVSLPHVVCIGSESSHSFTVDYRLFVIYVWHLGPIRCLSYLRFSKLINLGVQNEIGTFLNLIVVNFIHLIEFLYQLVRIIYLLSRRRFSSLRWFYWHLASVVILGVNVLVNLKPHIFLLWILSRCD